MLGYSVNRFLPRWWRENSPLWQQKLVPLLDWFLSNNNTSRDKMSGSFYQIVDKYVNTQDLPLQGLTLYIKEMGYGYITDFFQPNEAGAKKLVAFLVIIHFLKGSRKGLELILDIMGIGGSIVEWWETTPVDTVDTFTLVIDARTLTGTEDPDTYRRFEEFVRNYVYPEIKFKIVYNANLNYRMYSDVQGSIRYKFPCTINAGI